MIIFSEKINNHESASCKEIEISLNGAMMTTAYYFSHPLFGTGIFKRQSEAINGRGWYKLEGDYRSQEKNLKYDDDSSAWRVSLPYILIIVVS